MSKPISRTALRFSNRKRECELFRSILRRETPLRGLVIHSGGAGGVGKSTLLKMFEDECRAPDLSVPTIPFYFNAERLVKWQDILDRTANIIGEGHFREYIQLRAIYDTLTKGGAFPTGLSPTLAQHVVHFYGPVFGPLHTGSGDFAMERSTSVLPAFESLVGGSAAQVVEASLSLGEMQTHLTRAFLQALNGIQESLQIVWLVDTAGNLDDITKAWLIEMFWQIAECKTEHLILVVAGRKLLRYEPRWMERVAEMRLALFDEDIVLEILLEIWPDYDIIPLRMAASGLVEKSGGRPLDVITHIERYIGLEGEPYV